MQNFTVDFNFLQNNHHFSIPTIPLTYHQNFCQQSTSCQVQQVKSATGPIRVKKFKRYENIKCAVCGDVSSGFHYGAYTCEACKLFFIRTEKQKRKINPCQYGNCYVNIEKRKSCASCRYKSCIASGMNLNRRKFGRHTDEMQTNDRNHIPSVSSALFQEYKNLYSSFQQILQNDPSSIQNQYKGLFTTFYNNCLLILSINNHSSTDDQSALFSQEPNSSQYYDMILLIAFCVLFEYDFNFTQFVNQVFNQFSKDFSLKIQELSECLKGNKFSLSLKIISFLFLFHSVKNMSLTGFSFLKNDVCRIRLTDLIRSEFTSFKCNQENDSSGSLCFFLRLDSIETIVTDYKYLYANQFNYAQG